MDQERGERVWGVMAEKGEVKEDGFLEHVEGDVGVDWRQCE
jgi:hypothetical protein